MSQPRDYDSTVARIAGNIASGFVQNTNDPDEAIAEWAVRLARLIVAETKRTEPKA
jgi:hypothetical protein